MITKNPSGWRVDIQPEGRGGKRYRKTLPTKAEALRWEAYIRSKVTQAPDWQPPRKDSRRLSALVELWYENHGQQLRDGKHRLRILERLVEKIGNPTATKFDAAQFTHYRAQRLREGIKESTTNREHAYLRSVFNELARLGHWTAENPVVAVRPFQERQQALTYLRTDQIENLLNALEGDARTVSRICLATGARWGEAEKLQAEHVEESLITFIDTKSGQNRAVPIPLEFAQELRIKASGRLFKPCYEEFRRTIRKIALELPSGQLTHVLRHTFASHFMMNGGNILVLQRILGHQSLTMTLRYAHLAPEHLQEATRFNPLYYVKEK
jgi:site-specific recombinase XerD